MPRASADSGGGRAGSGRQERLCGLLKEGSSPQAARGGVCASTASAQQSEGEAYTERGFSSVLLGTVPRADGSGYDDKVLYKVRLPGNPIVGEGKPENQNHAVIFSRGEYLQTLDMNQDNYMGEAYKMRNLLEGFQGNMRIVGMREHIFSESGGAVAHFAAANEFVFGTIVQRFLTWPLRARFHYGHPDVWDKTWALTSGGISKSSKTLHVSEGERRARAMRAETAILCAPVDCRVGS